MKITCEYCGFLFDDSHECCPNCGAPNEGVVRQKKKSSKPTTIEELQDLYVRWNLPPYETTRFFIGQNYTGRRAFGIYRDESTGNFVVYKNKDNGQRAVRYEGTDEAFAVNEIYQRLKQEIVNQRNQAASRSSSVSSSQRADQLTEDYARQRRMSGYQQSRKRKNPLLMLFGMLAKFVLRSIAVILGIFTIGTIAFMVIDEPNRGYYFYENTPYYYYINEANSSDSGWFSYDQKKGCWIEEVIPQDSVPYSLKKNGRAEEYFAAEEWNESLSVADFTQTVFYQDRLRNFEVDSGYYRRDDTTYYHIGTDPDLYWYYFDDATTDWQAVDYVDIPEDFKHGSVAEDFYYTSEWDNSTQFTDFYDSAAFDSYVTEWTTPSSSSSSSNSSDTGWSWDDDDDDDFFSWDWDDNDWDWGDTDWDTDW